jgi:hypothetical protein
MSDGQERPWVRILGSVILGGCAVLAAMVPLYCSKQKSLETQVVQTRTDQTEIDGLRRQVAELQTTVAAKDAEITKLKTRPIPVATAGSATSTVQNASLETSEPASMGGPRVSTHSVTERGVVFQLKSCELSGSTVQCDLLLMSKETDRNQALKGGTRIIDEGGRENLASYLALGSYWTRGYASADSKLPNDVPVAGQVRFEGVTPGTKKLRLLEMVVSVGDSTGTHDAVIRFANIDL